LTAVDPDTSEGSAEIQAARLARAAALGDEDAAEALVRQFYGPARRAALAIVGDAETAQDVVQDAFERVFRHISRYDGRRPFGAWLHRIVVNAALNAVRGRHRTRSLSVIRDPLDDRDELQAAIDRGDLVTAIAGLDLDRRTVVVLRLVLGFSPEETADFIGAPVGTVHSRLSRALAQLRDVL
jgi:RNA polymerase sigma-70 factor (ECF subfamily)